MFSQPLVIGSTYRLKFKAAFERHGVCTTPGVTCLHPGGGVFRLEQITNFRDLILAGVKLYDVFFKPLGISEEKYRKYFDGKPDDELTPEYTTSTVANETEEQTTKKDSTGSLVVVTKKTITHHEIQTETGRSLLKKHYKDNVNYASYPLYKFVDASDSNDILWVPELTIDTFPEIDIREYKDLSLVVHLGYTHDPASLDPMMLSIRERMASYGWRPSLVKLYVTDSKWMSPAEFDAVKKLRVPATIETITPEMRTDMLGQIAIVDGQLKKIVEPTKINKTHKWLSEVSNAEEEVSIDAIQKQDATIDHRLFLVNCKDGETFATGDNYYIEIPKDSEVVLIAEATDFEPNGEFKSSGVQYCTYNSTSRTYEDVPAGSSRFVLVNWEKRDEVYYVETSATDPTKCLATNEDFDHGKFIEGKHYYVLPDISDKPYYVRKTVTVTCHKLLEEGKDYSPGEPCVVYRLSTIADESLQHYNKQYGGYYQVAYGHHGDYSPSNLVRKLLVYEYTETAESTRYPKTTDTVRDMSKTYYVVESDLYRKAVATDFNEDGSFKEDVEYYELSPKTFYIRVAESSYREAVASDFESDGSFDLTKTYYEKTGEESIVYRAATDTEIADPTQVLYVKQPDVYVRTTDKAPGTTYVRAFDMKDGVSVSRVLKESYSTLEALSLMGYKFDYSDVFGNSKTMTLQLEDIIETASQKLNVVLPDAAFDYDTFWKRFDNRIFRYTNYPVANDPTVTETIDIVVSRSTVSLLSQKTGTLLGLSGQISRETYVKDNDQQKRNYYMRYVVQSKALEDKKARVAVLEQALIEQKGTSDQRIAELEKQLAEKNARITELEDIINA